MLHYATLGSESNLNMKAALLGNFVKKIVELFSFNVYMDSINYT